MPDQKERVLRRGREGGRWVNERPTPEEFADWFLATMKVDPALAVEDYMGGVVLIPALDNKAKVVVGFDNDGRPLVDERPELSYIPYAKVETRIQYFWDLVAAHREEWVAVVEHVESPRLAAEDPRMEALSAIGAVEGWSPELIEQLGKFLGALRPGALAQLAHQLPTGFSLATVPVGDGYSHFLCCTIRVAIYDRQEWLSASGEARAALAPLRSGRGTKQVPLTKSYNQRVWADEGSLMKAETGALGRALGAAGIFTIPGSGIACLPTRAEILTRRGWRRYDEVSVGDMVLAYDTLGDLNRWTPLRKVSVYSSAPVCRLDGGKNFQAICTPDHKWAVRKKYRGITVPHRELREAIDLARGEPSIILAAYTEEGDSAITPRDAAVMGWLMTDGWLGVETDRRDGRRQLRATITQSKPEHVEGLRRLLGADATESTRTPSVSMARGAIITGRLVNHVFRLRGDYLTRLLASFGVSCREEVPGVVAGLTHEARKAMLGAMLAADGSRRGGGWVFTKGRRDALDTFQILCTLEGYRLGPERPMPDSRSIHQHMSTTRAVAPGRRLRIVPEFPEAVWCPTTDFGTWVARLDGRVFITGNTAEDMMELSEAGGAAQTTSRSDASGPAAPPEPPVRSGAEEKVASDEELRARAAALFRALSVEKADAFRAWMKERGHSLTIAELSDAALRGVVRKLEKLGDEKEGADAKPSGQAA